MWITPYACNVKYKICLYHNTTGTPCTNHHHVSPAHLWCALGRHKLFAIGAGAVRKGLLVDRVEGDEAADGVGANGILLAEACAGRHCGVDGVGVFPFGAERCLDEDVIGGVIAPCGDLLFVQGQPVLTNVCVWRCDNKCV